MSTSNKHNLAVLAIALFVVVIMAAIVFVGMDTTKVAFAMSIYVESNEAITSLEVEPSDTIAQVKAAYADEMGIPVTRQILYYDNQVLSDSDTLSDLNIQDWSTLTLVVSPDLDADAGVPVAFYNYDGSLISVENYEEGYGLNIPSETVVPDQSWGWTQLGWRCNGCNQVLSGSAVASWVGNEPGHIGSQHGESYHGVVSVGFTVAYDDNGNSIDNITFEPVISQITGDSVNLGVISRVIDPAQANTVTVNYNIVHNDGVNEIDLIPDYDKTAFTLTSANVVTKNDTILGAATVTGTEVSASEIRIVWVEASAKYTANDEAFLSLTFTVNNNAIANGWYDFGLDLNRSVAYYDDSNDNLGSHVNVPVRLKRSSSLLITRMQQPEIVIGYNDDNVYIEYDSVLGDIYDDIYWWEYNKAGVNTLLADSFNYSDSTCEPEEAQYLTVYYTYKDPKGNTIPTADRGDIIVTWYAYEQGEWTALVDSQENPIAPSTPGKYKVSISATAAGKYYAVSTVTRIVEIVNRTIIVDIANKTSVYGSPIVELTYTQSGSACTGDTVEITLSTIATSSSKPGAYNIVGNAYCNPGYYNVIFRNASTQDGQYGVYTITKKAVTIVAADQSKQYTGSPITPDQDKYTLSGAVANVSIIIENNATAEDPGSYVLVPLVDLDPDYYDIQKTYGTLTITSAAKVATYFEPFFSGLTETYSCTQYDLLQVNGTEAWWQYSASNNLQTAANVGDSNYVISITVTVKNDYTSYYSIDGGSAIISVNGHIDPAAITLKPYNQTSEYGATPVSISNFGYTVTLGTAYGSDNLNVTYGGAGSSITSSTNVGNYPITISASNSNYVISVEDGVYSVTKAYASVDAEASDVKYNRTLNYGATASVNNLTLSPSIVLYSDSNCTQSVTPDLPLNVGRYYVKATVSGNDNYYAAEDVTFFDITAVQLALPSVTYAGSTITLGNVTTDVDGVDLTDGTVVSYAVNGVSGQSYTATATSSSGLTYTVSSNTANYTSNGSTTEKVYSVSFSDEASRHGYNLATPANIPDVVYYVFSGQTVDIPSTVPTLAGYEFNGWDDNGNYYQAGATTLGITENKTMIAGWSAIEYQIVLKYLSDSATEGVDMFTIVTYYGFTVDYSELDVDPVKTSSNPSISYSFANKWIDSNNSEYTVVNNSIEGFIVNGDMIFVAVFNTSYAQYTITYYVSDSESTDYEAYSQFGDVQDVSYGETITYRTLPVSNVSWFKIDGWFVNEDRTVEAPITMPGENINVYAGYKFDIGQGDVNASGSVTSSDINLYRQWIVGGYQMTVIEKGSEWATVTDSEFDPNGKYFLERVADNNGDEFNDIRDVSITRMAIVGGYAWDILNGVVVTGEAIVRNAPITTVAQLTNALQSSTRATIASVINVNDDVVINGNGDMYLDLNGKTISVNSLKIKTTGTAATITIKNGIIVTVDGLEISAPNGNVVIEDVTAYDANGEIALQAASNSLHFYGDVEFVEAEVESVSEEGVSFDTQAVVVPATLKIAENTHVVVEPAADLKVDKLVVYVEENNVKSVLPAANATLAIDIKSEDTSIIAVDVDNITQSQGSIATKFATKVGTVSEFTAALSAGKSIQLTADLAFSTSIAITNDIEIDLNNHTVTFPGWGFAVNNASLTIGGGTIEAVEACIYSYKNTTVKVNGGEYYSSDNYVIGTYGTAGYGGNTIIIDGATLNGSITSQGYVACGIYAANSDSIIVENTSINVNNGVGILARSGNVTIAQSVAFSVIGDGTMGKIGDSSIVLPAGANIVLDLAAGYPGGTPSIENNNDSDVVVVVDSVADIDAVRAWASEIVLGKNILIDSGDYIYFDKDMILHLNGHSITDNDSVAIYVDDGATLIINGEGNVYAQEMCVMAFSESVLVINGGTYTSYDNAVFGTNGTIGYGGNTITINGGTFVGGIQSSGYVACGIYVANDDEVIVNAGTFNITNGCGILARSGHTFVGENVVFNVSGDGSMGKVGDSKITVPSGEALVLDLKANYPGGTPTLENESVYTVYTIVNE